MPSMNPDDAPINDFAGTAVLLTRAGMGQAEPALQQKVLQVFLTMLLENGQLPRAICLYTEGVKLAAEDSPALDLLRGLAAEGVPVIVCKTCSDFYGLTDHLRVGVVGGMGDILAAMATAAKVITV
ncbi:DsrE/DsrF-like family protein [Aquisphaera giovannonii]|uniref:DsrE/DsrF-like family protein n=1 Tax=Aquisphaera giovannonii TaxID=406548 RepID=A0A5B9W5W8_9BACT|nr:DsrE family protein [Aquisphaera giovannonii]QEH35515.1 DsrE/DsrF-like family protein [Aquisphaera giovannonii]